MGGRPLDRIRRAIAERGPLTFAEFMEAALYGDGGFYQRPPIGPDRHFVTSPHVHPVFASLLAKAVREAWALLDRPDPFPVVEVGAGDGTLARALLDELGDVPVTYAAVERSAGARDALASLPLAIAERLEDLGPLRRAFVLANELLDNLPFRVVRRRGDELVEVRVGEGTEGLVEVETACDEELGDWAPELGPREEAAVPTGGLALVDTLAATVSEGYALLVDYGSVEGGSPGPVHGYRRHRLVEAVLEDPGTADLTAGVDFLALSRRARTAGLEVMGIVDQRAALLALGFEAWLGGELARQRELLEAERGIEAVRTWGGRSRATLLADPTALGLLRWLLLATSGLPAPHWLTEARAIQRRTSD